MNRRSFLRGLGATSVVVAVPDVVRRYWDMGAAWRRHYADNAHLLLRLGKYDLGYSPVIIDRAAIAAAVRNFNEPVPLYDRRGGYEWEPSRVVGWVDDVFVSGDGLYGTCSIDPEGLRGLCATIQMQTLDKVTGRGTGWNIVSAQNEPASVILGEP